MYTCKLCTNNEYNLFLNCADFTYVRCTKCGLVQQEPYPDEGKITKIYDNSYFDYEISNENNFYFLMELGLKDIGFENLFTKPGTMVDIGCATGKLLHSCQKKGWKTIGYEICEKSADYARKNYNLEIKTSPVEENPMPENSIDFIHSSHVIEHVQDPKAFLQTIYTMLRPGGYAALTTPNYSSLQFKLYKDKWRSAISQHVQIFSNKCLKKNLIMSKFIIIKQISWGGIPIESARNNFMKIIKKNVDILAKRFNFGDVMLFLIQKGE